MVITRNKKSAEEIRKNKLKKDAIRRKKDCREESSNAKLLHQSKLEEIRNNEYLLQSVGSLVFIFSLNDAARYAFQGIAVVDNKGGANVSWCEGAMEESACVI